MEAASTSKWWGGGTPRDGGLLELAKNAHQALDELANCAVASRHAAQDEVACMKMQREKDAETIASLQKRVAELEVENSRLSKALLDASVQVSPSGGGVGGAASSWSPSMPPAGEGDWRRQGWSQREMETWMGGQWR